MIPSLIASTVTLLSFALSAQSAPAANPNLLNLNALITPGKSALINADVLATVLGPDSCTGNAVVGVQASGNILHLVSFCVCVEVLGLLDGQRACPSCGPHSHSTCGQGNCACACDKGYHSGPDGGCVPDAPPPPKCPYPNTLVQAADGTSTCRCKSPQYKQDDCGGCVCASPYTDDGMGGCVLPPSPHARSMKAKRAQLALKASADLSSDEYRCPNGETACPVGDGNGWECLDTTTSLDSCGGCLHAGGVNCLSINGVLGVACVDSRCEISSCFPGWRYIKGGKCVRSTTR